MGLDTSIESQKASVKHTQSSISLRKLQVKFKPDNSPTSPPPPIKSLKNQNSDTELTPLHEEGGSKDQNEDKSFDDLSALLEAESQQKQEELLSIVENTN